MASNKLAKYEKLPLKAYPEPSLDRMMETEFKFWIANLLSIKAENEEFVDNALPAIKKHFWSLGIQEVKKAFEMYADGQLSIEPISNYFDRVLVGKIFSAYKATKKTKTTVQETLVLSEEEKQANAYMNIIFSFDDYKSSKILDKSYWTVYDELFSRGILKNTDKEKKEIFKILKDQYPYLSHQDLVVKSKLALLRRFYDVLDAKGQHIKEKI